MRVSNALSAAAIPLSHIRRPAEPAPVGDEALVHVIAPKHLHEVDAVAVPAGRRP